MSEFTIQQVKKLGDALSVDWKKINIGELRAGMMRELQKNNKNFRNNLFPFIGVALVHISEIKDYYSWLESRKI